jgi:glycosyltransferase involved in cell wall biosynthesis
MVEDGVQGYFARDPAEWQRRLTELIRDPARRIAMGREGRARVEERYSTAANWPRFRQTLERLR